MTRTQTALQVAACSLWLFGALNLKSDTATTGNEIKSASTRDNAPFPSQPPSKPVERLIFITTSNVFAELERAPVQFNHDKHTAALEQEGCERCHPKDGKGDLLFAFPKVRDERNAETLMNSFHDECIGCHKQRAAEKQKAGPVTCGECHPVAKDYHQQEYLPILPEYYDVLRDTYHKDCLACHREPAEPDKTAKPLNWKSFYVKEQRLADATWPKTAFDYLVHDKHEKALEKKCELCHYLAPERRQQLAAENKEPACKDWLRDIDPTNKLTERKAAHAHCINCHLRREAEDKDKKSGPVYCWKCHSGQERPLEELTEVPRVVCEQKEKMLIELEEGARAKAVPFDHKSHEATSRSCQECHHKTLRPCIDCHTVQAKEEGGWITLAESYHDESSTWSCIGCHEVEKRKPSCAGCHDRLARGLVESACDSCHTGTLESLDPIAKLPDPKELIPDDTKDELIVGIMEKAYKPSKLPHLAIARKLTEIGNESKLASYFHRDPLTICAGCHHRSPLVKKTTTPQCATCHTARNEPESAMPTLLGAYHQQCLGCHQQMVRTSKELPQTCVGCHEEKPKPGAG